MTWDINLKDTIIVNNLVWHRAYVLHEWRPIAFVSPDLRTRLTEELCSMMCPCPRSIPAPPLSLEGTLPPRQAEGEGPPPATGGPLPPSTSTPTHGTHQGEPPTGPSGGSHSTTPSGNSQHSAIWRVRNRISRIDEAVIAVSVCTLSHFATMPTQCSLFPWSILMPYQPIHVLLWS